MKKSFRTSKNFATLSQLIIIFWSLHGLMTGALPRKTLKIRSFSTIARPCLINRIYSNTFKKKIRRIFMIGISNSARRKDSKTQLIKTTFLCWQMEKQRSLEFSTGMDLMETKFPVSSWVQCLTTSRTLTSSEARAFSSSIESIQMRK